MTEATLFNTTTARQDMLIKRARPDAAALVEAVAAEDSAAIAEILTTLDTPALYALAIVLADHAAPESTEGETLRNAVAIAARSFGTTVAVVLGSSRTREAVDARAVVAYVGWLLGISYSRVGREIGRDHSTVMHAVGRVGETPRLRTIAHGIAERLGWDREVEAS
jgi:chromosomal replication initiation ATPase DnaA